MTISVIHKRINTLEGLRAFLSGFPDRVDCTIPHHLLRAGKFKSATIKTQLYIWDITYTGPVSDWCSYTVGEELGCHFTGYVHIVSPGLHTVLFYNDGSPEVTAHQHASGTVEVSAWAPYYNSFKTATIQKGARK